MKESLKTMFNTQQQTTKRKLNIYNDDYNFLRPNYLLITSFSFFHNFYILVIQLVKKLFYLFLSPI